MLAVIIQVAHERYALAARQVVEVLPRVRLSRVPRAPAWHAGLLSYRGAAIGVMDVSRRLFDVDCPPRLGNRVLVIERALESESEPWGLLVEQVVEVRAVPDTKVPDTKVPDTKVPDTKAPAERAGHVLTLADGELLQMLDLRALFGQDDARNELGLLGAASSALGH